MTAGEGRGRWSERYRDADSQERDPSAWLIDAAQLVPPDATIADLAGGLGRHARVLASHGRPVVLVDFIEGAVAMARRASPQIRGVVADLWMLPFAGASFGGVLVANFLERELFPSIRGLVKPGGLLLYETFTTAHAALVASGKARGPTSLHYLLAPGELRKLVAPMEILRYREGVVEDAAGVRACASVVARQR